jgi:conjugal transfer pilus assembly protein TraW
MQRPLLSNGLAGSADLIAAAIVTISSAHAEYLGNYGNLWPIDEEHAVEQTINKPKEMERTGGLKERMDRYKADVIDSIENPDPVPGVQTVTFPRTHLLDPSVTVQENVMDDAGKLMVLAGTRINPLIHALTKSVLLIDARDPRQVALALRRLEQFPNDKVILTGGSYTKFMREHKKKVYFDLGGAFTTRFDLRFVPALVSQEGKGLKVQEIAFEAESGQPMTAPTRARVFPSRPT